MNKMWAGRTAGALDRVADDFNSSIAVDKRMYRQDIEGSMAHAAMLGAKGIIAAADSALIIDTLGAILEDIDAGKLEISPDAEDIHMFVEAELTARIGDVGKRLHTARSRNDQVALDLRLYLRAACGEIDEKLRTLIAAVLEVAEAHKDTILPGYTHLQRAQPITFGHHLLAYAMMLIRDAGRIADAVRRMNVSPLGCCALAGTTYPIDREMTAARSALTRSRSTALTAYPTAILRWSWKVRLPSLRCISPALRRRSSSGRALSSALSPSRTPIPLGRASCRRKRTRTWRSWCAARPGGSTAI